jgi:hypothetical protein
MRSPVFLREVGIVQSLGSTSGPTETINCGAKSAKKVTTAPSGSVHLERCTIVSGGLFMTFSRTGRVAAAATMLLSVFAPAQSQEKKIKRTDLPPAVQKAVVEQSRGATIRGFSQEKENGQTFYEAELMVNGHSKDVLMDVDGTVVEVEEQIPTESLSPAVRAGLQAQAENGQIIKVETLTKKGKLVAYEAKVLTNGKKSEVQVGPDGKALDHQE